MIERPPRRFAFSFASVVAGNYGAIGVSFVTSIVLTRLLGATGYGHLALLLTASQVFSFIVSAWTLTAIVQFGAREFAERRSLARTFWARTAIAAPWLAATAIVALTFAEPLAGFLAIPAEALVLVFAHFLLSAAMGTGSALLQAQDRMPRYGTGLLVDRLTALGSIVLFAAGDILAPLTALASYVLSSLIATIFLFAGIGPRALMPVRIVATDVQALWRFSLPLAASQWLGIFGTQWTDFAIIRRYLSVGDLGSYALAYQLAGVLQQVTSIFATLMLPRYSVIAHLGRREDLRRLLARVIPYWLLAYALALSLALMLAPLVVPAVFGDAFRPAVDPLALLILASVELAILNTFGSILTAYQHLWPLTVSVLLSAAANVALDLLLIPQLGTSGAALSTVCAYGISMLIALLTTSRALQLPALRYGAFALPVALTFVVLRVAPGGGGAALAAALVTISALVLVRAFGLRPREDIGALVGRRAP